MPDAPQAQPAIAFSPPPAPQTALGSDTPFLLAHKYDQVINPGRAAQRLTVKDKLVLSLRENRRLITLVPAIYSASFEQIARTDPKYGNDGDAYAEKFGAAMLRAGSTRLLSAGVFASIFHQDPRYYRAGSGSVWSRGTEAAEQAIMTRGDDGNRQANVSGIVARAAAAVLTLAYYPPRSQTRRVVLSTFATSIATNAGANLVLEFFPDLAEKYPILKRLVIR